jgi:hypothetical protein
VGRLARLRQVIAGWNKARSEFKGGDEAWAGFWTDYRAKNLAMES